MDGADGVFRTVSIGYLYCDVIVKLMAAGAVSDIELVVPLSGDIVEERNCTVLMVAFSVLLPETIPVFPHLSSTYLSDCLINPFTAS